MLANEAVQGYRTPQHYIYCLECVKYLLVHCDKITPIYYKDVKHWKLNCNVCRKKL